MNIASLPTQSAPVLLSLNSLSIEFRTERGAVRVIDDVSFDIKKSEILAVVGESGCGKSLTSLALLGLLPRSAHIIGGSIFFHEADGSARDLTKFSAKDLRRIRGNEIAMIFQEPMTSLNPTHTVGHQIAEAIRAHRLCSRSEALRMAAEALVSVGIPDADTRLASYPHEMSGGMRQRVMIAMALSCNPSLLVADEPTTALDVTIQAEILELIKRLQANRGMSVLFVTHDLGVVADIADRVIVMYAGQVVEDADVADLLKSPLHPYTRGLLRSVPRLDRVTRPGKRLDTIEGVVPDPMDRPSGCSFHPRCQYSREDQCSSLEPSLDYGGMTQRVRCHFWRELAE